MKRRQRTEVLIKANISVAKKLADEIELNHKIITIEEPNSGLVMVKMRETAQKHLFYLGELLVTEAKVQVNESIGLGIVQGNNDELAYCLAVIDAAYNADLPETAGWAAVLQEAQQSVLQAETEEALRILKTKVDFETVDEEVKA